MAARFHGRGTHAKPELQQPIADTGFGEWWAAIAVLALAAVGVLSLSGSAEPVASGSAPRDPTPEILASISPAERSLEAIERAFAALCVEPVLLALELEPDCETGVITLPDGLFDYAGGSLLRPEVKEDLAAAVQIYLARMRRLPALWESLEAIEIRGHTDPTALDSPYTTNLVSSQRRSLGVLLFLVGPTGLPETERNDLERLAVVSGVSFSRPPEACPDSTRECYEQWRRVEIRPVLSEPLRRGDWARTLEDIRVATERTQQESWTQNR